MEVDPSEGVLQPPHEEAVPNLSADTLPTVGWLCAPLASPVQRLAGAPSLAGEPRASPAHGMVCHVPQLEP